MRPAHLLLGLLACIPSVTALPMLSGSKRPTGDTRSLDFSAYSLPNSPAAYFTSGSTVDLLRRFNLSKQGDYVATATELVRKIAPYAEFRVSPDHYVGDNGIAHVYLTQAVGGVVIEYADFGVNIGPDGHVFSYSHNFFNGTTPPNALAKRSFTEPSLALTEASRVLNLPVSGVPSVEPDELQLETYTLKGVSGTTKDPQARLVYLVQDGALKLAWKIEMDIGDHWLQTYVDAIPAPTGVEALLRRDTERILGVVDYRSDFNATFLVYPFGAADPEVANYQREAIVDPWIPKDQPGASPSPNWLIRDGRPSSETRGNNVEVNMFGRMHPKELEAAEGRGMLVPNRTVSAASAASPEQLIFAFPYDPQHDPVGAEGALGTQLFYTTNAYHDLLYALGFTERAGNFQQDNGANGGLGNDALKIKHLDIAETTGFMATGPDGQPPIMVLARSALNGPGVKGRDVAFDATIAVHEYTHGMSQRLTGGPAHAGCLTTRRARGLNEGWSDFFAVAVHLRPGDTGATPQTFARWTTGLPGGARVYPYSTRMLVNPLTYENLTERWEEHGAGEVWASVLVDVMWNLIDKHGYNYASRPRFNGWGAPTDGRYLAMKLVMDAMALQPCNPSWTQARDALLDADRVLTGGQNRCEIWRAMARRGLGEGAGIGDPQGRVPMSSKVLPDGC